MGDAAAAGVTMGDIDVGGGVVIVELRELNAGATIGEGGNIPFEDLRLQFIALTEAVEELKSEVAVINRPPNGVQIIRDGLQLARVVGDGHITTRGVAEGLAEGEVA
jgi:hypothetical protein